MTDTNTGIQTVTENKQKQASPGVADPDGDARRTDDPRSFYRRCSTQLNPEDDEMNDHERLEVAGDRLSAAMARLRGRAVSAKARRAEIDAELPEVVLAVALGVRDEAALGRLRRERSACENAIADVDVVVPAFEKYQRRIAYAGPRIARGAPDALDGLALLLEGVSK